MKNGLRLGFSVGSVLLLSIGISGFSVSFLAGCNNKEVTNEEIQKTTESRTFYALGQALARRTDNFRLSEKETDLVLRGYKDWAVKRTSVVNYEQESANIQQIANLRGQSTAAEEKRKGAEYMARFIQAGGKRTASGLGYKIVKPGSAKKPKATDSVQVHYEGKFLDGRVFDSSYQRNLKAQFPLTGVIRGWTEGLQLLGEGGELELVVPSDLAYGDQGNPGMGIAPGSTLIFKIEFLKIFK